jgi:hypothetical protein
MQTRSSSEPRRSRSHGWRALVALPVVVLAPGLIAPTCSDAPPPPPPETEQWEVRLSPEAPQALRWTADDLVRYLTGMGLSATLVETLDEPECGPGRSAVVLVGDGLSEAALETEAPTDQTFRIEERRCDRGRTIELSGGGLLGRQYAAYEWLHQLGVRFFHPEEEFLPDEPRWPPEPLVIERTPPFRFRSVSLHLTHPLELGDAFSLGQEEHFDEAVRYIDWTIKNLASDGLAGVGDGEHAEHGIERGFPRSAGFSLYGIQQGGHPVIDPDDPRSDEDQIAAAIDERMGTDPARYPQLFNFTFNPTEFTEAADTDVVRQLTFIADYFAEHYPDTILTTINHGTGSEPTPTYGVRYFDLPRFAPPNLGVKVHSLMFYDLFRPAPVYGNADFGFLYDFMVDQYQVRRIWHFPEAAWWLTFDIAVPLYLPITIEARDRDIQGIAFMLEGGLDGHHVFGTGHEWGYWQNEYCSFRMAADLEYRWTDCVADLTSPMGAAAGEVAQVIEDLVGQQERDLIYGGVLPYVVGTDPETEAAWDLGVEFHPLPPSPQAILGWDLEQVTAWQETTLPELRTTDDDCAALVARLDAVEAEVPERARSFFDEIRDGIEVTGLRARHGWQVYGALVLLRESRLRTDAALEAQAARWLDDAAATTEAALAVIHRREEGYRYSPLARSIAGGPDGTEDSNWTIYTYRYLNRTHHGYYYTRIDELAEDAFAGSDELAALDDALLGPGAALSLRAVDPALADVTVTFGDGEGAEGGPLFEHEYAAPGAYRVDLAATRAGEAVTWQADVASLDQELATGFTGHIVEPTGAIIIEGVLPALVFGPAGDAGLAIGFGTDESGSIQPGLWSAVPRAEGSAAFLESAAVDLTVPIVTRSTGAVMASIVVEDAVLTVTDDAGPATLTGRLATQAVIDAVVAVGGFDETGARDLVATMLGYTAETLPADVAFVVEYSL